MGRREAKPARGAATRSAGIRIERLQNGPLAQNCYVITDRRGRAAIIDPGGDALTIIGHVRQHALTVCGILNTHAHHDHIGAVPELRRRFGAPFFLHSRDSKVLNAAGAYHVLFNANRHFTPPTVDRYLDDVGSLQFGTLRIDVLETPGHSPGSVCFVVAGGVFTGDTLLPGRIGRVDLPGGDAALLRASLRRLSLLPPGTRIFPGHGEPTTIAHELRHNAALRDATAPADGGAGLTEWKSRS